MEDDHQRVFKDCLNEVLFCNRAICFLRLSLCKLFGEITSVQFCEAFCFVQLA